MNSPLESFTRQLPTMPLDRIERTLESLKGSVGGNTKGKVEGTVAVDFRIAILSEIARRSNAKTMLQGYVGENTGR